MIRFKTTLVAAALAATCGLAQAVTLRVGVSLVQLADNFMPFKWINVK